LEEFYRAINFVQPSLIRTEADEVTYNLHIILRFEIEKELIEGSLKIEQIPEVWNQKTKEYFRIIVPDDARGSLQDVHWSEGLFGYFPTYTLGNLYSAQFYEAAKNQVLNLEAKLAQGQFQHLLQWLRKNIHVHGKFYMQDELIQRVTGEKLSSQYFLNYLNNKYEDIYKL
jgi:carboxypeptidase Taq